MSPQKNKIILLLATAILLLTAISMACNLPAGLQERVFGAETTPTETLEPTFTPQPLPPTIVETDPPQGSTINVGGPITLYFNQNMDQASVEEALSGEPELTGAFSWSDPATLIYTPDQPLLPNTKRLTQLLQLWLLLISQLFPLENLYRVNPPLQSALLQQGKGNG